MRRVLIALAMFAVTAQPSFAVEPSTPESKGMRETMRQHPEMRQQMMRNPQHLLMMAYHKNVISFGKMLAAVARQGETVPRDVARTAIAEMRRSVEEMEKHRAEAMQSLPAGMPDRAAMQKMMDEHLVDVKTHLRQLDDLAKSDRIPSQEVLKHLEAILAGCQGMGCGGMHHGTMHRGPGGQACRERMPMMPERHRMMQEMMQKMKAQDADMAKQVDKMRRASKEKKVDVMADIVAQLVQQRADLTDHMEKMQSHMKQGPMSQPCVCDQEGAPMPPPPGTPMFRNGEGPDEDEDADVDETDMDDVTE